MAIPGKVVQVKGKKAKIKQPDHNHWVDISMIDDGVKIGDYLLTYQNAAINKVHPEEAQKTIKLINGT